MRILRRVLLSLVSLIALVAGLFWLYGWDARENRGYHWGYWGQYNRVLDGLRRTSGGTVDRLYANEDLSMEEFGFVVRIPGRQELKMHFGETDGIRSLHGSDLDNALRARIAELQREDLVREKNAAPAGR